MKTEHDIVMYILNDWCDYFYDIIDRRGVSATVFELTNAERTALEMYRIAANCFM